MSIPTAAPEPGREDALALLCGAHAHSQALADACRRVARLVCTQRDLQPVAEALCGAVCRMAQLEEELLYPAARAALPGGCVIDMAALEHVTARQIIRQMRSTDPGEARYEALAIALADCVERHARHERVELFPRLRDSCLDWVALGQRLDQRRDELAARDNAAGTPVA